MFIDQNGNPYFGDMRPGDREATPEEVILHASNNGVEFKKLLLMEAQTLRDTLLMHLQWFYVKAAEDLAAAQVALAAAVGQPAIDAAQLVVNAAQTKKQAISDAIASLHAFFSDPRIIASVNGGVKLQARIVYLEIVNALRIAHEPTYDAVRALAAP